MTNPSLSDRWRLADQSALDDLRAELGSLRNLISQAKARIALLASNHSSAEAHTTLDVNLSNSETVSLSRLGRGTVSLEDVPRLRTTPVVARSSPEGSDHREDEHDQIDLLAQRLRQFDA